MSNTPIVGIIGIILNLLGAVLVIDKLVTFKFSISRFENLLKDFGWKFLKRMLFNMVDQYIKRFPNAFDIDLLLPFKQRIINEHLPDFDELQDFLNERARRKKNLNKETLSKKSKRKKDKRNAQSLYYNLKHSYFLRILIYYNPYFFPVIFCLLFIQIIKVIQKHQLSIGVFFFILGHILQIIEKFIEK